MALDVGFRLGASIIRDAMSLVRAEAGRMDAVMGTAWQNAAERHN